MRRRVIYQSLAWVPIAAGAATIAFTTTSAQLINKTVIYEDRTTYSQTPVAAAETITADKWYRPLNTPTRRQVTLPEQQEIASPAQLVISTAVSDAGAIRPLDEPLRLKRLPTAVQQSLSNPTQLIISTAVTDAGAIRPLDEPLRLKRNHQQQHYTFIAAAPGSATAYNWFQQLDEPLRIKRTPKTELSVPSRLVVSVDVTNAGFTTQATIRTPAKQIITDGRAYANFTPTIETVTVDKWYRGLDIPVREWRRFADQQDIASPPGPAAGDATIAFTTTSGMVFSQTIIYEPRTSYTQFISGVAETVTVDKWFSELSRPVRIRNVAAQQGYTLPPRLLTTTLEWWQQLVTPTRRTVTFPHPGDTRANVNPVVPFAQQQLDAPYRLKGTINLPALSYGTFNPIVPLAWQQLDSPHRLKGRINYPALWYGTYNPVVPLAWRQLDSPLRRYGRLDYPAHSGPYLQIETITADKWFSELTRPTRRPRLYSYPFEARAYLSAFPGNGNGTTQPWPELCEPVRRITSLHLHSGITIMLGGIQFVVVAPPHCRIDDLGDFDDPDTLFVSADDILVSFDNEDDPFAVPSDTAGDFDNEDEAPC